MTKSIKVDKLKIVLQESGDLAIWIDDNGMFWNSVEYSGMGCSRPETWGRAATVVSEFSKEEVKEVVEALIELLQNKRGGGS